jgi:hypothetical protein
VAKDSLRDSLGDSVEGSARDSARDSTLAPSPTTFATDSADETAVTKGSTNTGSVMSKFPSLSNGIQFGETHVVPI